MLTITPKINTNSNFKATPLNEKAALQRLAERISAIKIEEIPEDTLESSASRNLFKRFTKISLKYKNLLFKLKLLKPVNKKYDSDETLKEVHYKNGAYRKYCYVNEPVWYSHFPRVFRRINEEKLPDGTIKTYTYVEEPVWNSIFPRYSCRIEKKLPDGTKIVYFKNGHVKEKYDPKGKLIESNQVK